jgi:hypothetical protein
MVCSLARDAPVNPPVKLLGFTLDRKMAWKDHLCSGQKQTFPCLLSAAQTETPFLVTIHHAMFHSHIGYGLLLWGHAAGTEEILKLQKRAVRLITFSDRLAHCKPLFARLGIFTIYGHFIFLCLLHVKNNLSNFPLWTATHNYNTRQREKLDVPRVRLSKTQSSYSVPTPEAV